jgi:hypothetical protein
MTRARETRRPGISSSGSIAPIASLPDDMSLALRPESRLPGPSGQIPAAPATERGLNPQQLIPCGRVAGRQ